MLRKRTREYIENTNVIDETAPPPNKKNSLNMDMDMDMGMGMDNQCPMENENKPVLGKRTRENVEIIEHAVPSPKKKIEPITINSNYFLNLNKAGNSHMMATSFTESVDLTNVPDGYKGWAIVEAARHGEGNLIDHILEHSTSAQILPNFFNHAAQAARENNYLELAEKLNATYEHTRRLR